MFCDVIRPQCDLVNRAAECTLLPGVRACHLQFTKYDVCGISGEPGDRVFEWE